MSSRKARQQIQTTESPDCIDIIDSELQDVDSELEDSPLQPAWSRCWGDGGRGKVASVTLSPLSVQ